LDEPLFILIASNATNVSNCEIPSDFRNQTELPKCDDRNQPINEIEMSRLIVLTRHGSVRQVNIKGPITTIGRDPACGVHIDSLGVSRHHAAIHWTGDRFVLTDLSSRNGTFVNKTRIRERALANGDAISAGDCQLRFLYENRTLPNEEALRLITLSDDLGDIDAAVRERSDWATFFRQGGRVRHGETRRNGHGERRV